jgi:hypothetical protein
LQIYSIFKIWLKLIHNLTQARKTVWTSPGSPRLVDVTDATPDVISMTKIDPVQEATENWKSASKIDPVQEATENWKSAAEEVVSWSSVRDPIAAAQDAWNSYYSMAGTSGTAGPNIWARRSPSHSLSSIDEEEPPSAYRCL